MIKLNEKYLTNFVTPEELEQILPQLRVAIGNLVNKQGPGKDYLGWLDLPVNHDRDEFARIKQVSDRIRSNSDVLVVVGIGGSYLGARAVIEALSNNFRTSGPEVLFVGHQMSPDYLNDLLAYLEDKELSLNVISKSGTTTEPAIAFRILKTYMEDRYGDEANQRIFVTTDRQKGALKQLANQLSYESFVVPDDVGGRFSVLTAVGLLPIAVAGIDIDELMAGALSIYKQFGPGQTQLAEQENPIYRYAMIRNILARKGYTTEVLVNYLPSLMFLSEWWKQLYGESEGKDGRGLFPASVNFTSDLHSMGQYLQDGQRILFETVMDFETCRTDLEVPSDPDNLDGLNYLAGKSLNEINRTAMLGTMLAHEDGGVPILRLEIPRLDPTCLGALIYFFEYACGLSGHLLAVNPFNQPGVEAYKRNMFALLNKPGYEKERASLLARL